ncbi:hypothetical protein GAMM_10109 [Gammaproteobacteria bacterium]
MVARINYPKRKFTVLLNLLLDGQIYTYYYSQRPFPAFYC